jgi:nucleotide sugar dehydrogenase
MVNGGTSRIVVVGGGKMGLPLACMFAHRGASVAVCDKNVRIVERINEGIDPHNEPEVGSYLREAVAARRLRASTNTTEEVAQSDAVVVLVSAMLTAKKEIDWENLVSATRAVAKGLRKGMLVSYETTVPVGGCRQHLLPILESSGLKGGTDFHVVFSPERVKSQLVFARLSKTPKVVGGIDAASATAAEEFYGRWLGAPTINVGTLEAAEFVKLSAMIYRDVNIALANELAAFAETAGLDMWPILDAADTDGETHLLRPGIGVGGHCTPVYPHFLIRGATQLGLHLELVELGRSINDQQPQKQVERLARNLGGLAGRHVHILGLAFRPRVREDANSTARSLQAALIKAGAKVTIEDPLYEPAELVTKGFAPGGIRDGGVDAVILNTAHPEFQDVDFFDWRARGVKAVLDGRALWCADKIVDAGLIYLGIGIASRGNTARGAS